MKLIQGRTTPTSDRIRGIRHAVAVTDGIPAKKALCGWGVHRTLDRPFSPSSKKSCKRCKSIAVKLQAIQNEVQNERNNK